MSLDSAIEEAEAVLDSAEMLLETFPGHSSTATDLEMKVEMLEKEIQDPESEDSIRALVDDVQDLMKELEEEGVEDDPIMGDDPVGGPGGGFEEPDDDVPPF